MIRPHRTCLGRFKSVVLKFRTDLGYLHAAENARTFLPGFPSVMNLIVKGWLHTRISVSRSLSESRQYCER